MTERPAASPFSSTISPPSKGGRDFIGRICSSFPKRGAWARARRCSPASRNWRWNGIARGWNGGCWTGTNRPSPSTVRSARGRWTNGRCSASTAKRSAPSPQRILHADAQKDGGEGPQRDDDEGGVESGDHGVVSFRGTFALTPARRHTDCYGVSETSRGAGLLTGTPRSAHCPRTEHLGDMEAMA